MLIGSQCSLVIRQIGQEAKAPDARIRGPVSIDRNCPVQQLAEIIPIKVPAVLEFPHQSLRIERIARLPEF
jgi:hypothetical protein